MDEQRGDQKTQRALTVAEYLEKQIKKCGKTQMQLATELGFLHPNMVSMLKLGKARLPLAKIGLMAKALNIDGLQLYKMVMEEYEPRTWETLQSSVFKQPIITESEIEILEVIRGAKVRNPIITSSRDRERLLEVIDSFKSGDA